MDRWLLIDIDEPFGLTVRLEMLGLFGKSRLSFLKRQQTGNFGSISPVISKTATDAIGAGSIGYFLISHASASKPFDWRLGQFRFRFRVSQQQQIDDHDGADRRQYQGTDDGAKISGPELNRCIAVILQKSPVFHSSREVHDNSQNDHRGTNPDGPPRCFRLLATLQQDDLSQEQAEFRHQKSESHHRQARSDPGQQGAFGGEYDAWIVFADGGWQLLVAIDCC